MLTRWRRLCAGRRNAIRLRVVAAFRRFGERNKPLFRDDSEPASLRDDEFGEFIRKCDTHSIPQISQIPTNPQSSRKKAQESTKGLESVCPFVLWLSRLESRTAGV